ncbi:MAG: hypothetical protein AAF401_10765 [Pseudomonadota bacterium]
MSVRDESSTGANKSVRRRIAGAAVLTALIPLIAIILVDALRSEPALDPASPVNSLFRTLLLFVAHDGAGAWVWLAVIGAGALAFILPPPPLPNGSTKYVLAVIGAVASWLIGLIVFGGYGFSMDEFLPAFQAEIFRNGMLMASIPPIAATAENNFLPVFGWISEEHGLWASYYRPVHAAFLALTPSIMGVSLLNAVMTAVSVIALWDICRRLFPETPGASLLGVLLFLSSPQVLITAGTGFAFTSHLALNLIWLALFLKGGVRAHCTAAVIGALAIGLHQVHVHPLFAAPFLAATLFGIIGRWTDLIPYAVTYSLALPIWILWPELALYLETGDAGVLPSSLSDIDYFRDYLNYAKASDTYEGSITGLLLSVNILRFALWLSPAVLLLAVLALFLPRSHSATVWIAAAGVALMIFACHVLMPNQTQTWGARYYHPVIGNLIILAVAGYDAVCRKEIKFGAAPVALVVLSMLVLLPMRVVQVDERIGPRAALQNYAESLPVDVVVATNFPTISLVGLVRNDPFLRNRPLIIFARSEADIPNVPGEMHILTLDDLDRAGLPQGTYLEPGLR